MPSSLLMSVFGRSALGRLLRQIILDHPVVAARAANGLAQLEILLDRQLLEAGDEDVLRLLEILLAALPDLFLCPISSSWMFLVRQTCFALNDGDVQMDARPHGGADGHALDVLALGRRRLGLDHRLDQAVGVFHQLAGVKTHLAARARE